MTSPRSSLVVHLLMLGVNISIRDLLIRRAWWLALLRARVMQEELRWARGFAISQATAGTLDSGGVVRIPTRDRAPARRSSPPMTDRNPTSHDLLPECA